MNVKPIAKNIVKHMYKQGLSTNAFSIKSGISKACIVKVSNGTVTNVRPKTAKAIADTLGVDFDELFIIQ